MKGSNALRTPCVPGKRAIKCPSYRYLGQPKDVYNRIRSHKYGAQNAFIKRNFKRSCDNICDKLLRKRWQPFNATRTTRVQGIYAVGVKRPGVSSYCYLGQSKDLHNRIRSHKYGKQKIDAFIKRHFKRNGGKDLRIKWIRDPKHKANEGAHIRCLERKLGYQLKYNVYRGNN